MKFGVHGCAAYSRPASRSDQSSHALSILDHLEDLIVTAFYYSLINTAMEKDKDPESHELLPSTKSQLKLVDDAAAKEAPGRVQAFWLLVWMLK